MFIKFKTINKIWLSLLNLNFYKLGFRVRILEKVPKTWRLFSLAFIKICNTIRIWIKVIVSTTLVGLFPVKIWRRLVILFFVNFNIANVKTEIFSHLMILKIFFEGLVLH